MTSVTFGDFLRIANHQFELAATTQGRGLTDATGSVHHVRRIVIALGRCFDGCDSSEQADPVVSQLRHSFATARAHLEAAEANLGVLIEARSTVRLRTLASAADALTAGADLIETHTSVTTTGGRRADRSGWARVLRSGPVHGALVAEAAHWAEQLAPACLGLSGRPALRDRHASSCLAASARCLSAAAATATAAGSEEREDWWKLLADVPVATSPARRKPVAGESVEELCNRITDSADGIRALAFTMADQARWAPDISAPAWRRAAQFATSASQVIRFAIEGAAASHDHASWQVADLALGAASDAWRQATGVWRVVATDTTTPVSALTIEAEDLLLRTCRLVFQDPEWDTARQPELPAHALADPHDQPRFGQVLGVLHQAADALAQMAIADRDLIDRFAGQQRFYIQNKILDDEYARRQWDRYIVAPTGRVALLVDAYRVTTVEAVRAAEVLDELVIRHAAPSTPLALARKAVPRASDVTGLDTADVAKRLEFLDRAKYAQGVPPSQIDTEAVVRAYRDEELTLQECADKFTTSTSTIKKILQASDTTVRTSGPRRTARDITPDAASVWRPEPGPVEQEARAAGITDPMVLARAADMDRTIARVRITTATSEATAIPRAWTVAQLAGLDKADASQTATEPITQGTRARKPTARNRRTP